MSNKTHRTK